MNYWITADTHFGHTLLEEDIRPPNFSELILKRLGAVLSPDDVLIHLGDINFGDDLKWNKKLIAVSSCKKWLIRGAVCDYSKYRETKVAVVVNSEERKIWIVVKREKEKV